MSDRVDIVLPGGEKATVPKADLEQALAAGAQLAPADTRAPIDTGYGLLMPGDAGYDLADKAVGAGARAFGAASAASGGLSDQFLSKGAYVLGGEKLQRDTMGAVKGAKEAHPYQYMAGEAAGLMLGPVGELGEAVQAGTAAKAGAGLLGEAAGLGLRGAVEGAAIGAGHQITEDALEGHDLIGQQIFASAAKDALLGGAIGGALGAGGYYLGQGAKVLSRGRGPASDAVLDEVVGGAEGAGRVLKEDAKHAEGMIADLQNAGATSEQAAKLVSDVQGLSRDAGPLSGPIDGIANWFKGRHAGLNDEQAAILAKGYEVRQTRLYDSHAIQGRNAMRIKGAMDRVYRAEDAMYEANFVQRADRMAKLIDPARADLQRDLVAKMAQEVDATLSLLESTATKGGGEVAVRRLRKELTDLTNLNKTMGRDEAGRIVSLKPKQVQEIYMGLNRMKQEVGHASAFGGEWIRPLSEAQIEFGGGLRNGVREGGLYQKLRLALEDEAVWGVEAGSSQRVLNETFSTDLRRASDVNNLFGVTLDEAGGVPLRTADAEKIRSNLLNKLGDEAASDRPITSIDAWRDRNHRRIAALREHHELSPAQAKLIDEGEAALKEFDSILAEATKESEIVAKLERQQVEEQGRGMGGLLGLASDLITRPLTSMQRLAEIKHTTRGIEKAIERGFAKVFKSRSSGAATETVAPRAKDVVAKEIGEVRSLAGSPEKFADRIGKMLGDLPTHAPKIAKEVEATAARAIYYLAKEAPIATGRAGLLGFHNAKPRYSDQQIASWDAKRTAVMGAATGQTAPESIIADMKKGRLNRDAIQAIEFVSPKLFAQMQDMARTEIERLEQRGLLDQVPYQRKAAIATLLKVPPDGTWTAEFMRMMQASKAQPPPEVQPAPGAPMNGPSKRAIQMNTDIYATEGGRIEGGPE